MDIKEKLYTYPVLSYFSDDYKKSKFTQSIKEEQQFNGMKFKLKYELENEELKQLIKSGYAQVIFHIEARKTSYREIVISTRDEEVKSIKGSRLNGDLSICTFIIAKKNIENYTNKDLNEDYEGILFNIKKGSILAIAEQYKIFVNMEKEDLRKKTSIFQVLKRNDSNDIPMKVDCNQDKIKIWLNEETYTNYHKLSHLRKYEKIIQGAIVVPALMSVLEEIVTGEEDDYVKHRWFSTLNNKLEKTNKTLNIETIKDKGILLLAQELVDIPIITGLKTLLEEDDDEEED